MLLESNLVRRCLIVSLIMSFVGFFATAANAQMTDHPQSQELAGAAEVGFAPFMMPKLDGTTEGFNVDMNTELAKRLGRPGFKVVEVPWANIFAGLYAKRYEYIAAPTTITAKRASQMLFAEPYIDVGLGFITRKDNRLSSIDDIKGKKIGVVSGSVQDDWMTENGEKYGVDVMRFDGTPDSLQAVSIGRTDGHMSTVLAGLWLIKKKSQFTIDVSLPAYGRFGLAFRPDDVEFRNLVEKHLECMKLDGTLAGFYEKWFGAKPDPKSSTVVVYAGYGAPGWAGHTPEPHAVICPLP
jgi:polar amino acid transport system substrate-binding protein